MQLRSNAQTWKCHRHVVTIICMLLLLPLFAFPSCAGTYPSRFSSPSRPGGPWRSGTTFWHTAAPSPLHPHSDRGPDLRPGLRGSTSASLQAPDTWSCTQGSHSVHWASALKLLSPGGFKQPPASKKHLSSLERLTIDPPPWLLDVIRQDKDQKSNVTLKKMVYTNPKQETMTAFDKP